VTPSDKYLVVAEITTSVDLGAHITAREALYWVTAPSKRSAAAGCVRAVKAALGPTCFGVKIQTVVSSEQWGTAYFAHIDAEDKDV